MERELATVEAAARMSEEPTKMLARVARKCGRHPAEAYRFVREGLGRAVETVHGPMTPELLSVTKFLADHEIDLTELLERLSQGTVDPALAEAIDALGGYDKLNRHVSGQDLCWALRDLALAKWGLLAEAVLRSWHIRETLDFGQMVFDMIEHDLLQRQPDDSLNDFRQVYSFKEALVEAFQIAGDADVAD